MSKRKKAAVVLAGKPRNLLHNHPLLRKSAVHEKTVKAKRQQDKVRLRKAYFSYNALSWQWIIRKVCASIMPGFQRP